ncbi:hypothetical protein ACFUEN_28900 [Streptomyces griseorubiginosus]|uniref:hypothetical protein n=1 Tax=Streptomyces griseorubiginosus TaxID=67304 RepID=UPI00363EF456
MAALPRTIPLPCPICRTPVDLPIRVERHKVLDGRLVMDLAFDTEPLVDHCKTAHPDNLVNKPWLGEDQPSRVHPDGVTVHVHQTHTDEGSVARAVARGAAETDRLHRFGGR